MEYNQRSPDAEHNRRRGFRANFENVLSDKTIFVIGMAFGLIGPSLWVFTGLNILTREHVLSGTNLSVEEKWRVEGSLHWWKELNARFSFPLAAVLFIGGLITMLTTRPGAPEEIE